MKKSITWAVMAIILILVGVATLAGCNSNNVTDEVIIVATEVPQPAPSYEGDIISENENDVVVTLAEEQGVVYKYFNGTQIDEFLIPEGYRYTGMNHTELVFFNGTTVLVVSHENLSVIDTVEDVSIVIEEDYWLSPDWPSEILLLMQDGTLKTWSGQVLESSHSYWHHSTNSTR